MGEGAGILGCGATTGVGSAFFAGAPASSAARGCWRGCGGGGTGGGGGGCCRLKVLSRSTALLTISTLSPDRITKASAACTAKTAAMALALSGRSAVPL